MSEAGGICCKVRKDMSLAENRQIWKDDKSISCDVIGMGLRIDMDPAHLFDLEGADDLPFSFMGSKQNDALSEVFFELVLPILSGPPKLRD